MKIKKFEELECWQTAKTLVNSIYGVINDSLKLKRDYRLRDQLTSAAISVMSNIAEGFSRQSNKEFIHFLYISKSSAAEIQSLLYVILEQGYIDKEIFSKIFNQADSVSRMNSGLIKYLSDCHKPTQ
jgi:four helix bundle protein